MPDKRPRGRPRPPETIERDELILKCLRELGPQTRNALAEGLGLSKVQTYLALDRLRKHKDPEDNPDPLIRICADTAGPGAVWSADVSSPCP